MKRPHPDWKMSQQKWVDLRSGLIDYARKKLRRPMWLAVVNTDEADPERAFAGRKTVEFSGDDEQYYFVICRCCGSSIDTREFELNNHCYVCRWDPDCDIDLHREYEFIDLDMPSQTNGGITLRRARQNFARFGTIYPESLRSPVPVGHYTTGEEAIKDLAVRYVNMATPDEPYERAVPKAWLQTLWQGVLDEHKRRHKRPAVPSRDGRAGKRTRTSRSL